jgi:hypothetical protein
VQRLRGSAARISGGVRGYDERRRADPAEKADSLLRVGCSLPRRASPRCRPSNRLSRTSIIASVALEKRRSGGRISLDVASGPRHVAWIVNSSTTHVLHTLCRAAAGQTRSQPVRDSKKRLLQRVIPGCNGCSRSRRTGLHAGGRGFESRRSPSRFAGISRRPALLRAVGVPKMPGPCQRTVILGPERSA